MRLTQIRLAGFKSFVDPTTLSLVSNLTGVVGPNGCGKSNVIDAVRWVTGESSARQLRGEALEDVIFNGSNARKPVGRAAVELKFDNSEGRLGGQYSAFREIAVRRELARDGASRFYINGTRARRRDVVDLFLGTGLGGRNNYAVIQQGAVSRLIEAKPEEMRLILEETAGISKYKERRRETENRIRHTRENLERLDDLVSEVERRLSTLERQAANAEKYKQYKAAERRLRAELLALRWQALTGETSAAEKILQEVQSRLREADTARNQAAHARDEAGKAHQAAMQEVQQKQAAFYDVQSRAGQIRQALTHAQEVAQMRQRERGQLEDRLNTLEQRQQEDEASGKALAEQHDVGCETLKQINHELEAARQQQSKAEAEADHTEQAWDELGTTTGNPVQQLDGERTRARYARQQYETLLEKETARRSERDKLPKIEDEELTRLTQTLAECEHQLEADREKSETLSGTIETHRTEIAALEKQIDTERLELSEREAELTSLRKLQQAVLREDDETINNWLTMQGYGRAQGVARRIRIRDDWQIAAEAVLGPMLKGFSVDALPGEKTGDIAAINESITLVESDRAAVSGNDEKTDAPPGTTALADGIEGSAAVKEAAADIYVAADLTQALAARSKLGPHQKIVTPAGYCVGAASLTTPPVELSQQDIHTREQRIHQLTADVETRKQSLQQTGARLTELQDQLTGERAQSKSLDEQINQTNRTWQTLKAEREGLQLRAKQTRQRDAELAAELEDLARQAEQAKADMAAANAAIETLEEQAEQFTARRQNLRDQLARARQQRDGARAELAAIQSRHREEESKLARLVDQQGSLAVRQKETQDALAQTRQQLTRLDSEQPDARSGSTYREEDLDAANQAQAVADRELRMARETLATLETELETQRQKALQAEQALDHIREQQQQAKVDVETTAMRRQGIADQLTELGEAPEALAQNLPEEATIEAWDRQIKAIEHKLSRLGAINLAAIEEKEEAAERARYLNAQRQDLVEALTTLESAIEKIDRETRARFKATFNEASTRFARMFPKLFGGGEAELVLTDDDWLATGVRVTARPPGKRNASIQLLSGGEKTLTALALLFALFELNPAPFCMLDEIDAPLDDANVSRFCNLVREMSAQVQFIIITHNKLTMELTRQLHGVTMAEAGVSRLVSVDIEQALDLAG